VARLAAVAAVPSATDVTDRTTVLVSAAAVVAPCTFALPVAAVRPGPAHVCRESQSSTHCRTASLPHCQPQAAALPHCHHDVVRTGSILRLLRPMQCCDSTSLSSALRDVFGFV
jgi:hypothetical protein